MATKSGVVVLAEIFGGIISPHTHEMFAAGVQLSDALGEPMTLALLGSEQQDVDHYLESLDPAITIERVDVTEEEPFPHLGWADAAVSFLADRNDRAVLAPGTGIGVDWTPRVAAKLRWPLASWVTGVSVTEGAIRATRDVLGGRAETHVSFDPGVTAMIALEPGMVDPVNIGSAEALTLADVYAELAPEGGAVASAAAANRPRITQAERVVSGGRGLIDEDGVRLLEDLADALDAAVGASGAAVLMGLIPHDYQVGSSGVVISPKLYMAVGLSGSPQHTYGMKDSQFIVAINQDENAPIFQMADIGVVGNLHEIVPALIAELK